uniref:Reverse transcriptase domain-containing protein n=1 Tax=Astyanax mexicanus TaxID=7994 RepID=A0A3B1IDR7_ASTMX
MVDHYLLLDKLYSIGLSQNALLWFSAYLHNRRQCVVFHGSQSDYLIVDKGVPQGSILGPLLFSIFINDLPQICSQCSVHLYADDTVIYVCNSDLLQIQNSLQSEFNLVQNWLYDNKLILNKKKSCCMLFGMQHGSPNLRDLHIYFDDGSPLEKVDSFKYLGLWVDSEFSFKPHVDYIIKKTYGCLSSLYRAINCFTFHIRKRLVSQLILPIIGYADIVYMNTSEIHLRPLNVVFNSLCRFVLRCPYRTHHCFMFESINWLQPKSRRQYHWVQFIFKCIYLDCPPYLKQFFVLFKSSYSLRHMQYPFFFVPRISKEVGRRSFNYKAPSDWNNLPFSLKKLTSLHCFRKCLFSYLKTTCLCF